MKTPLTESDDHTPEQEEAVVHADRSRHLNVAGPITTSIWSKGTYKTGDGDTPVAVRPGSLDAFKLPSKGTV